MRFSAALARVALGSLGEAPPVAALLTVSKDRRTVGDSTLADLQPGRLVAEHGKGTTPPHDPLYICFTMEWQKPTRSPAP